MIQRQEHGYDWDNDMTEDAKFAVVLDLCVILLVANAARNFA
jgi:hypothetical protein